MSITTVNDTPYDEDVKYFFVFHGGVPSILMARVAYRAVGKVKPGVLHDRKKLNCPYCTFPFTFADREIKVELFKYPARNQVRCQFYPLCPNCGKEIGIFVLA